MIKKIFVVILFLSSIFEAIPQGVFWRKPLPDDLSKDRKKNESDYYSLSWGIPSRNRLILKPWKNDFPFSVDLNSNTLFISRQHARTWINEHFSNPRPKKFNYDYSGTLTEAEIQIPPNGSIKRHYSPVKSFKKILLQNGGFERFYLMSDDSSTSFSSYSEGTETYILGTQRFFKGGKFPKLDFGLYGGGREDSTKYIWLDSKTVKNFIVDTDKPVTKCIITNCQMDEKATIFVNCDTLYMSNIKFDKNATVLVNGYLHRIDSTGKSKILNKKIIVREGLDNIRNLTINFEKFDIKPSTDSVNSDVYDVQMRQIFGAKIAFYTSIFKTTKAIELKVDSCEFSDSRNLLTSIFIVPKKWWNNYGYDKYKVIYSSLTVFGVCFFFNSLFFKRILKAYPNEKISDEISRSRNANNAIIHFIRYEILCLVYSAILFFGLTFQITKLDFRPINVAFWILIQYTAGIISIGYIASLILNRL